MSVSALVASTVKSFAAPTAVIAAATSGLDAFGVPAVPVKTSTLPALACAGAAAAKALINIASEMRHARLQTPSLMSHLILDPSSEHRKCPDPTSRGHTNWTDLVLALRAPLHGFGGCVEQIILVEFDSWARQD